MTDTIFRFCGAPPTVRLLTPRHPPRIADGRGAPKDSKQREALRDHLTAAYSVDDAHVAAEVDRLSIVERTWLEIEMADRSKATGHTSDYDPLR